MKPDLTCVIEAVLQVADQPLSVIKLQELFDGEWTPKESEIIDSIKCLQKDCEKRGVELIETAGGYRYQSKQIYSKWIQQLYRTTAPRLSKALLETIAIIAYKQPVTRGDIELVRGVPTSHYIMQRLFDRSWIKKVGVRQVAGKPELLGTTNDFLTYFNLSSLDDLPKLNAHLRDKEITNISQEIDRIS